MVDPVIHYSGVIPQPAPRSVSFPYLQVAREHGRKYSEVLLFADFIDSPLNRSWPGIPSSLSEDWQIATLHAHGAERNRRTMT